MPRNYLIAALVAVGCSTWCSTAAGASVARIKTITYSNRSSYGEDVRAAAAAWSTVGLRLRIVPARPGAHADITVVDYHFSDPYVLGEAAGPVLRLLRGVLPEGGQPLQRAMGFVVAHEFGHEIGLGHTGELECSLMIPSGDQVGGHSACHEPPDRIACGPQPENVRAAARIWGWLPGGERAIKRPGFGTCLKANGPAGADATSAMCPSAPLVGGDEAVLSHVYNFSPAEGPAQSQCEYRSRETHAELWKIVLDRWTQTFSLYHEITVAGNCHGQQNDTETAVYSPSRFLSVRAIYTWRGPPPQAGFPALLKTVLGRAEAGGVGLVCSAPQD